MTDPEFTSRGSSGSENALASVGRIAGEGPEMSRPAYRSTAPNRDPVARTNIDARHEAGAWVEIRRMQQDLDAVSRRIDAAHRLVAQANRPQNHFLPAGMNPVRAKLGYSFDHLGRQERPQWPVRQQPVLQMHSMRRLPAGTGRRPQTPPIGNPKGVPRLPFGLEIEPSSRESSSVSDSYRGPADATIEAIEQNKNKELDSAVAGTGIPATGTVPVVVGSPGWAAARILAAAGALMSNPVAILAASLLAASTGTLNDDPVDETHDLGDGGTARITGNRADRSRIITVTGGGDPATRLSATLLESVGENAHVLEITGGTADRGALHPSELARIVRRLSTADGLIVSLSRKVGIGHNNPPRDDEIEEGEKAPDTGGGIGGFDWSSDNVEDKEEREPEPPVFWNNDPDPQGEGTTGGPLDWKPPKRREDIRKDGSYRDPDDVEGMRRAEDGEAMIKSRDGKWHRVSQIKRRDNVWKGQWGEAVADKKAADDGWIKIWENTKITGKDFKGPGIDGIYKNPKGPPDYYIAEAKTGRARLGRTKDGLQLDRLWIRNHLQRMVRNREISAAEKRRIMKSYQTLIQRVDDYGNVTLTTPNGQPFNN